MSYQNDAPRIAGSPLLVEGLAANAIVDGGFQHSLQKLALLHGAGGIEMFDWNRIAQQLNEIGGRDSLSRR